MRGDRPWEVDVILVEKGFTPHARGSTAQRSSRGTPLRVYPACAGIDLRKDVARRLFKGLPRMRGDRPLSPANMNIPEKFTPHARGSTRFTIVRKLFVQVYPAGSL